MKIKKIWSNKIKKEEVTIDIKISEYQSSLTRILKSKNKSIDVIPVNPGALNALWRG